jgi:ribonuclease HIII
LAVSLSISPKELQKLRNVILARNLKRSAVTSEHELLRINDGPIGIIVYKSGKLVHNGTPESMQMIESILEKEANYDYLLGTDEVGKGEWYGPLVVVCAGLTPEELKSLRNLGVRDSKLLQKTELEKLARSIIDLKILYREVILMPETYNARYSEFRREGKSLNDMLAWAHATAIRNILTLIYSKRIKIVIDKFDAKKMDLRLNRAGVLEPTFDVIQSPSGDTEVPVSVASIIAKHIFEKRVDELNRVVGIDLRKSQPSDLPPETLSAVAKIHFKNVSKRLERQH